MTRIAKHTALLTLAALTLSFQGVGHAQSFEAEPIQIQERAEVLQERVEVFPAKETRAASWQGKKVAVRGRDVVSYFENEKPLKGSKDIVVEWDKTKWRFASEKNAELFKADPHKYIPEFGGFCPVALADNNAKIGKSTHYTVIDEKLYLNYNRASKQAFQKTPNDFLVKASLNF